MKRETNGGNLKEKDTEHNWILEHSYIEDVTEMLSGIILNEVFRNGKNICDDCDDKGGECKKYGRDFGTLGEQCAAKKIIEYEMKKTLGLSDVHKELISENWNLLDYTRARGLAGLFGNKMYRGCLAKKRWNLEWYLKIKVFELIDGKLEPKEEREINSFPLLKRWKPGEKHKVEGEDNLLVVDGLENTNRKKNQIVLLNEYWRSPYQSVGRKVVSQLILNPRLRAFIIIDCFDGRKGDTRFMSPSFGEGNLLTMYPKPGFSISGNDGRWIREQMSRNNRKVKAQICSKWDYEEVKSYNVIGEIRGKKTDEVSIICAHYDCWWNQGTIDEAAETALVLGIAKYIKDNNKIPNHTIKFIAFSGEEWGMRGVKDYVKKHLLNGNEKIIYAINPGNFGHKDTLCLPFVIGINNDKLSSLILRKARAAAEEFDYPLKLEVSTKIGAEDTWILKNQADVIQFSRSPFKGYHRDGNNHTKGDTMDALDHNLFRKECEIVRAIVDALLFENMNTE